AAAGGASASGGTVGSGGIASPDATATGIASHSTPDGKVSTPTSENEAI
ncbi:MAG: hypothetical protein JWN20_2582, partial [Jatrophihabitantaceae bacterium]|nr:hypothetical protein [Jatrophihabitantaceae bacterium]